MAMVLPAGKYSTVVRYFKCKDGLVLLMHEDSVCTVGYNEFDFF